MIQLIVTRLFECVWILRATSL